MELQKFKNKPELFDYIKNKFKDAKLIVLHGSTAYGQIKNFSDFDIEVYGGKVKKPYYELWICGRKSCSNLCLFL